MVHIFAMALLDHKRYKWARRLSSYATAFICLYDDQDLRTYRRIVFDIHFVVVLCGNITEMNGLTGSSDLSICMHFLPLIASTRNKREFMTDENRAVLHMSRYAITAFDTTDDLVNYTSNSEIKGTVVRARICNTNPTLLVQKLSIAARCVRLYSQISTSA